MNERIPHHCGLFGIFGHPEAARLTYLGLYALQHRGEESAGMVTTDGQQLYTRRGMGLVHEVFDEETLVQLPGRAAIGHVRYSTTGSSFLQNAQPLFLNHAHGALAVAHNGNLVNAQAVREALEREGRVFQTTVDSEALLYLVAEPPEAPIEERLTRCVKRVQGAFSLLFLTEQALIGVRDPNGFRPLWLGQLGGASVLTSETCALDLIGAKWVREIEPGEIVIITESGIKSLKPFGATPPCQPSHCIFEHVYFARPDSTIFGDSVHLVRKALGRQLAREYPVQADLVMSIPDSGNSSAIGYSQESGIPLEVGMTRNHYIGRTFIQPSQAVRDLRVRIKFNPLRSVLNGQRIIVVDDSIVRGTTCKNRVNSLREAGAQAVHMRISCPPIMWPCFYGIDFPTRKELIAANQSVEAIRQFLNVDSLGYLSLEGLLASVSGPQQHYCTACYSGRYPIPVTQAEGDKFILEKRQVVTQ